MKLNDILPIIKKGEGLFLEFKRSTGELREGMQTICAFMNGGGGLLLFGVRPDGVPEGQDVSDKTIRDIAQILGGFEPPVDVPLERLRLKSGREIIAMQVKESHGLLPYTYDGRAYERVGSSTKKMPQDKYEKLLLARAHSSRRWENQTANEITIKDIDRDEVFRIVDIARSLGRLVGASGRNLADTLDRLGVRKDGQILRAAMVLFGKNFMPDYPQCELRMARFRGTDKTEFMDQRQIRGSAFKLLEEAEMFCQRHFPMPAKIVPEQLRRVENLLIPPDAMREILVNALIHRDYSIAGGAVSLAIFDDRVEIWSAGAFPKGITPASLSRNHLSVQRNPTIADIFHRAGLIEKWGRGTNRVIDMCQEAGISKPIFAEITGAAVVTIRIDVVGIKSGPSRDQVGTKSGSSRDLVRSKLALNKDQIDILLSCRQEKTVVELMETMGRANRTKFRNQFINTLLAKKLLVQTIPDKPNSRLQRYRTSKRGMGVINTR